MATAWLLLLAVAQDGKEERPETVIIKIKSVALRERPSYGGSAVVEVPQGTELKFVAWEGAWVKVITPPDKVAYVHKSAVIDNKKFKALPEADRNSIKGLTSGEGGDVAMGTKGFTPEMEAERKNKNNLHKAYEKLDRIERMPAYLADGRKLDARLARFAEEGKLRQ